MTKGQTIPRRKTKSFWIGLVLAVLAVSYVVYRAIPLSYQGEVKDAETGQALDRVNVLLKVYCTYLTSMVLLSHGSRPYGSGTSTSDSKGMYRVTVKLLRPSPWNHIETYFTYFKPGYFPGHYSTHLADVGLYRMTYYLNYYALLSDRRPATEALIESEALRIRYNGFRGYLKLISPPESAGVFYRCPGAEFTRIYGQVKESKGYLDKMSYCLLDQNSKAWLVTDSRGRNVDRKDCSVVPWESMSSETYGSTSGRGHLYASRSAIFSTDWPHCTIDAHRGNISAVAGVPYDFMTIEDNGRFLCHYATRWAANSRYPELGAGPGDGCIFLREFRVADLVGSREEGVSEESRFTHVSHCDGRYFVVARTARHWHVCKVADQSSQRRGKLKIRSFPATREITAMAVGASSLYIAFANEGIRKYDLFEDEEVRGFFDRSNQCIGSNVRCLAYGSAVNIPAVYAVTGTDTVYRFSKNGVPDYPVTEVKEESPKPFPSVRTGGAAKNTIIIRRGAEIRRVSPSLPGQRARSSGSPIFPRHSSNAAEQASRRQDDEDLMPLVRSGHPVQVITSGKPAAYRQLKIKRRRLNALLIKLSEEGNLGLVAMYLESGANVNSKDELGNTALMKASVKGHSNVVKLLIHNGADVNARNNDGSTALMMASEAGHHDLVTLLTTSGADAGVKDRRGRSALWWAQRKDDTDLQRLLLESGAK